MYGLAEVSRESYPDCASRVVCLFPRAHDASTGSAWDPAHPYYDPKTKQDDPTWFMVRPDLSLATPHCAP